MAFQEKRAWIMAVVSAAAYAVYLVVLLSRTGDTPLAEASYVVPLLWTIGGAIVATMVLEIVASIGEPRQGRRTDQRDREIGRVGDYIGNSFVVIGAVAGLVMAMFELAHFWIANAIYLAFVLSAILGSIAKIFAYRRGFQSW